jgi:pimeloyl-ACP methyl ester carboxylesterase
VSDGAPYICPMHLLHLLACSPDAPKPEPVDEAFVLDDIPWEACDLYSEGGGPSAECATVQTPLRYDEPEGALIDVFVKRYRPAGGSGAQALWMLQGGPGASGHAYEALSEILATRFPDVDYIFPDHRGTGRSTRLGCSAEDADSPDGAYINDEEWDACQADAVARYGADLEAFSATNAANDLGILVGHMQRQSDQPQHVLGVSYGTYWAHRYLQLYPDQADGVILDSLAAPGLSLYRQDEDSHIAAQDFFDACGADSFCSSKLGEDPWAVAEGLMEDLNAGHCAEIAVPEEETHVLFRRAFASLLMNAALRTYIPAIVYRAERCSAEDIEALRVLMAVLTQEQPPNIEFELWGYVLTQNIIRSEFGEEPIPTAEQLEAIREGAVASRDITLMLAETLDWPAYAPDPYVGGWAETGTPMLMLQGGLDPATLREKALGYRDRYAGPHQTWVDFPTATHTTLSSSAFIDEVGELRSCGTRLMMAFVTDPEAELDTSCVELVEPLDFELTEVDYNRALFGTRDAWE